MQSEKGLLTLAGSIETNKILPMELKTFFGAAANYRPTPQEEAEVQRVWTQKGTSNG
jgi:hypothetical protein